MEGGLHADPGFRLRNPSRAAGGPGVPACPGSLL